VVEDLQASLEAHAVRHNTGRKCLQRCTVQIVRLVGSGPVISFIFAAYYLQHTVMYQYADLLPALPYGDSA
jgi:hypothetical protein